MYGLKAIAAANGWSMALAGALIVISGLAVLSFIVSQLHRIVALIEKDAAKDTDAPARNDTSRALAIPQRMPDDIEKVASFYRTLTDQLDSPFALQQVYALGVKNNFPHPHLSLNALRQAGLLIPAGQGRFTWSN